MDEEVVVQPWVVPAQAGDVPRVLCQYRFDGRCGFPGGVVDPPAESSPQGEQQQVSTANAIVKSAAGAGADADAGETPREACLRELFEEVNFVLEAEERQRLKHVSVFAGRTHSGKPLTMFFFACELTRDRFAAAEAAALTSSHHGIECFGTITPPLFINKRGMGLPDVLRMPWAGSALQQFVHFLKEEEIVSRAVLEESLRRSGLGCSLDKLLTGEIASDPAPV